MTKLAASTAGHPSGQGVTMVSEVTAYSAAAVAATQTVTAILALRKGRRDYADAVWGPGLAAVAFTGAGRSRRRPAALGPGCGHRCVGGPARMADAAPHTQ